MLSETNNLFIIYIGGAHEKSYIELHDMRFVIAKTIEETHDSLIKSWWGDPKSLHIDAWGILNYADGYEISIRDKAPIDQKLKLYFVNLGGYDSEQFTELHKNIFIVAENDSKAKVSALKQILDWQSHHRDYQFELDKIMDMESVIQEKNLFIHLKKSDKEIPFKFTCKYTPIAK